MTLMTKDSILKAVQDELDRLPLTKVFGLHVVPDFARNEESYWYVVVEPSRPGIPATEYVDALGTAEEKVRKSTSSNVLVIPASGYIGGNQSTF